MYNSTYQNNKVSAFKGAGSAMTTKSSMEDAQSKVISQNFSNYAQQTSLHGWQYIDSEPSWWRKSFWTLVSCYVIGWAGKKFYPYHKKMIIQKFEIAGNSNFYTITKSSTKAVV